MKQDSGERVAEAFQRGSSKAVETVRERVQKIVAFRGYRMSTTERQDVEQEVMTHIWQAANRPGFDPGSRFWGFVEVVTARRCIDWLRAQYKHSRESEIDDHFAESAAGPLGQTLENERTELAHRVLARLDKPCRDLIYLHFGLDNSYRELASVLGKTEGALRVQMFRCIRKARQILTDLNEQARGKTKLTVGFLQ